MTGSVGWIGLGAMGARMSVRLVRAGHELTVWNRTPGRAEPLRAAGARVAASPADVARHADVIFLMVADATAVAEVTEGSDGIAAALAPGTTVIDMSTSGPEAVARLRGLLPGEAGLLDAPVLGSLAEAEAGTLTVLVGGPGEAAEPPSSRALSLLSVLGTPLHLGPSGSGAAAKLMANLALMGVVGLLGETLALADGLGLPRDAAWRVLDLTPLAAQARRRRPAIESGAYPARFALAMARKDADLIAAAVAREGTGTGAWPRLVPAIREWYAEAAAAGLDGADYTAVLARILSSRLGSDSHIAEKSVDAE